jgi:hypothetical protein
MSEKWPQTKVLSITPPAIPIWAVYYEEETDEVIISPIVTLALVEKYESNNEGEIPHTPPRPGETEEFSIWQEILPVDFQCDRSWDWNNKSINLLGYSDKPLTNEEGKRIFAEEIERYKRRLNI